MKTIDVLLVSPSLKPVIVKGIPVKIGVIEDLFVATPVWYASGRVSDALWNITHIPSGHSKHAYAPSVRKAVRMTEEKIKALGKQEYQKAIRKAMNSRRKLEKERPEWFRNVRAA